MPRQHLPQSHGRVRDEAEGGGAGALRAVRDCLRRDEPRGDRQPRLSAGPQDAGGARHLLRRQDRPPDDPRRLRLLRLHHHYGPEQPAEHPAHCRARRGRQDFAVDGLHRPPARRGRPVVHRRLPSHLGRRAGGLRRVAVGDGVLAVSCWLP